MRLTICPPTSVDMCRYRQDLRIANLPIASIMPTANRRAFAPGAIVAFLAQTVTDAELIILVVDLVTADPRIRYFRETLRRPVGVKRTDCAL